jgi:hypothetical protein
MNPLAWLAVIYAVMLGTVGLVFHFQPQQNLGVALPQGTAVFETSLQSRISSTDTSMTLVSVTSHGETLSGYSCFTLDEGRTDAEFVCGTVSGTTVSSLERGISFGNGTTTSVSRAFAHRVGANVKVTDFPLIQRLRNQANGTETFPNLLSYANTVLISGGSPTTTIATKYYVDTVVTGGAADANEVTKGLVELATAAEAAAGTSAGGTGARLVVPNSIFNATPSATVIAPVTSAAGKLAQGFFDLAQAFTWTAQHTFSGLFATNASSTNATTTSLYIKGVLSSLLKTDGSGQVQAAVSGVDYARGKYTFATTSNLTAPASTYATSTNFLSIPASTITASSTITFKGNYTCGGSAPVCTVYLRTSTGQNIASFATSQDSGVTGSLGFTLDVLSNNSTSAQSYVGFAVNYGSDNGTVTGGASVEGTAAVNLSGAITFAAVIQAAANTTMILDNYSIVVNP